MNDVVIRAEGLGKSYLIGHQAKREPNPTLREVVTRAARGLVRSASDMARGRQLVGGDSVEEFWALKDVSFEIKRGDVVGIIGRNGAGKSTLLKILSRITEPSQGRVSIKGRVASLLEVGTGFHPELSGRENIFLNGAILGMTRAEIRRKFDEIVAFAEVEKFLDTPVKRYSSGMYVRLAFAVAAHLEPEILVVDEVLAVGDAEFQKKCLGKMGEVAGQGRTVLFVSHQLGSVAELCQRCILLRGGEIASVGAVSHVVQEYLGGTVSRFRSVETPNAAAVLSGITAHDGTGASKTVFDSSEEIEFILEYVVQHKAEPFRVGLRIGSQLHGDILTSSDTDSLVPTRRETGTYRSRCVLPRNFLSPGTYTVNVAADIPMKEIIFNERDVFSFTITPIGAAGSDIPDHRQGIVRPILQWERLALGNALNSGFEKVGSKP
jgi:lipopolysaccharide transport system ATP-binding protein